MLELHIQYPTVAALSADSPTPVGLAAQGATLRGQDADIAAAEKATAAANQAAQYASETAADIRRRADAGEFDGATGPQGPQGEQGPQGATGPQGAPGHTPEAGVDYYTAEERSAFVADVLNQFPGQKISNATKATSDANGRMISPVYNQFYSNLGTPSLFELAALAPEFGCKSDFLPKANVQYEISKDLGETWEPFEVSDNDHATL